MIVKTWFTKKDAKVNNPISPAYENRLFGYHPAAARLILYFLAYQIKNTFDTIVWNDGVEFILHHVLCLLFCAILVLSLYKLFSIPQLSCLQKERYSLKQLNNDTNEELFYVVMACTIAKIHFLCQVQNKCHILMELMYILCVQDVPLG